MAQLKKAMVNLHNQMDTQQKVDVIPFEDYLFMIGDDGFYQYDYSDLQNIQQISFIPVKKED